MSNPSPPLYDCDNSKVIGSFKQVSLQEWQVFP